jgi:MFS superfamily sulfate permease-like transporter
VREEVRALIAAEGDALRLVVWDLSTSPYVDIASARMLGEIQRELASRDVELRIVEARASVRDLLRAELGRSAGEISRQLGIEDVLSDRGSAAPAHAAPLPAR